MLQGPRGNEIGRLSTVCGVRQQFLVPLSTKQVAEKKIQSYNCIRDQLKLSPIILYTDKERKYKVISPPFQEQNLFSY
jgi:hypothetical protein